MGRLFPVHDACREVGADWLPTGSEHLLKLDTGESRKCSQVTDGRGFSRDKKSFHVLGKAGFVRPRRAHAANIESGESCYVYRATDRIYS